MLTNEPNWESINQVLFFFFLMFHDWIWWACLFLSYFFQGALALPGIDDTNNEQGLITTPVQALLGITTFELFKTYGIVNVSCILPSIHDSWAKWLNYIKSYFYFVLVVPVILAVKLENNDWIVAIGFVAMALYRFWVDKTGFWMVCYVFSYSSLVIGLNRIPYNPFFGSLYYHAVFIIWFVCLQSVRIYKIVKNSHADSFPSTTRLS